MKGVNDLFSVNENDVQFLIDSAGQKVLVNDKEMKAVITNPTSVVLNEYEQRYIHSIQPISQGDIVTVNNEKYLVVTEAVTKRTTKYKSLMRHCNYIISVEGETTKEFVGYDQFGAPVYKIIVLNYIDIPSIIDNKNFSIDGQQLRVAINQIIVVIQDNHINRDKFKVNNTFKFVEGNYKVLHRDFTKKGLMMLTCQSTAS